MKQQKVVGRFINDNSIVKQHNKKLSMRYELKEPLWVTW